jgi:hypothetical protein
VGVRTAASDLRLLLSLLNSGDEARVDNCPVDEAQEDKLQEDKAGAISSDQADVVLVMAPDCRAGVL